MRNSLTLSALLHVVILLIVLVGLPRFMDPLPPPPMIIPVEIATVGEMTNTRIREKEEEKPPQPQQEKKEAKPTPPPENKKPPEEIKKKDIEAEALPEEKPDAEIKKKDKPKEKKKEEKPPEDKLTSVLKNLAKLKQETPPDKTEKPDKKLDELIAQVSNAPALADRLMISEEDALRRQISRCWNMPVGAREAEKLVVEVLIEVNQDRTVRTVEIVDRSRLSDPYFRSAAEAAVRALRNPQCSPLELPPDKYNQWRVIRFNFDPRDML
ncbi:MAG: hypothetical protein GC131_07220 [Alphaproteobacteria bacterium]|nr:hypothetical protein [Alphaproteobacteria bacterium]